MEAQTRHARNARWQRNKGSDDRKQAADQNSCGAKTSKESLRHLQLVTAQKNIRSISLNQRTPAVTANLIGDDRAQVAANRSGRGRQQQVELPLVHQESG